MCELMGLCFQQPIKAGFTFREFATRDHANADGWGIGWYPDQSAAVIKEPVAWRASAHSVFLETYRELRSAIYIAHVRHKTMGGRPTHADTHPFQRELRGREYLFAHNGTLVGLPEPDAHARFLPLGTTDSEAAFCHLLDRLAKRSGKLQSTEDFLWLHDQLKQLNDFGKLNCLLTDGQSLFAFRDREGLGGLSWRSLELPESHLEQLADRDLSVDLMTVDSIRAIMVATCALDEAEWDALLPGQLIVAEGGKLVFVS